MHGCSAPEHRAAARLRTRLTDPQPRLRRHCQHALIRPQQSGPPPSSSTLARMAAWSVGADERLDAPSCRVVLRCRGRTPGIADRAGRLVRSWSGARGRAGRPAVLRRGGVCGARRRRRLTAHRCGRCSRGLPSPALTVFRDWSPGQSKTHVKMMRSSFSKDRSGSRLAGLRSDTTASLLGLQDRMDLSRTSARLLKTDRDSPTDRRCSADDP